MGYGHVRSSGRHQERPEKLYGFPEEDAEGWVYHVSIQRLPTALPQQGKCRCACKACTEKPAAQRARGHPGHYRQAIWHDAGLLWQGGKRKAPDTPTA